jgi:hypothetical protein
MRHFAYLDPGSGTLLVQALLGGAAGVAVLVKTKGRRLFRKAPPEEAEMPTSESDEAGAPHPPQQ